MKTPGVYVVEKNAFPNSIVEVETAIPAFIGYTEKAEYEGSDLSFKPKQISSIGEFHDFFGGAPAPMYTMSMDGAVATNGADAGGADASVIYRGKKYTLTREPSLYSLYYSMRMFFSNGGGKCFIVSVGDYSVEITRQNLLDGITPLTKEQLPTLVVIPEAVRLPEMECKDVQQQMLKHCEDMANRFAILDVWQGWKDLSNGVVENFRNNIGTTGLKYGAAYYPWLETSVLTDRDVGIENIVNKNVLVELFKSEVDSQQSVLDDIQGIEYSAEELRNLEGKPAEGLATLNDVARDVFKTTYRFVMQEMRDNLNLLPPSGALAGVYTQVDTNRGVWKAPANVSVATVNKPHVAVSHDEQEDLNVTPQGKSVNAIREFIGEGVVVWGARTLDGNSLDWRYINVRRTLIMLEESVKLAGKAYVFEPNSANTWIAMKGMISSFLTGIWKRGGLAGASPEDAFSVHVGLGETMTPDDILEGILRVTVLVAPTRPAEFIEITFQQQQQKS